MGISGVAWTQNAQNVVVNFRGDDVMLFNVHSYNPGASEGGTEVRLSWLAVLGLSSLPLSPLLSVPFRLFLSVSVSLFVCVYGYGYGYGTYTNS